MGDITILAWYKEAGFPSFSFVWKNQSHGAVLCLIVITSDTFLFGEDPYAQELVCGHQTMLLLSYFLGPLVFFCLSYALVMMAILTLK